MNLFALLMLCGAGPLLNGPLANFDFAKGTLAGWEVKGRAFHITGAGVSSSDGDQAGRTGLLRREFVVPVGAGEIRFEAFAVRAGVGPQWQGDSRLDVLLAAAGKRILPKRVKSGDSWRVAPQLLPPLTGRAREYSWDVAADQGRTVQIIIGDADARPGSFVYCSGFRIVSLQELETQTFTRYMDQLADKHQLAPAVRFESRHFVALSNAEEKFTRVRLRNCELIYTLFHEHFRRAGFALHEPPAKLMVAIFDSHTGFDAYMGAKLSPFIRGVYHPDTNRLLIYDYGDSEAFLAWKRQALANVQKWKGRADTQRYTETVERYAREFRSESNLDVTMHETAHQLSFNTGMLNRRADIPMWLAEGLACYCEASDHGAWKGIGGPNGNRQADLDRALTKGGSLIPLRDLLASDQWRDHAKSADDRLLGYAQSWALFRMLMEQQPHALRKYLELIYDRRAPDHRLTDFRQCFGADLSALERRYEAYVRRLAQEYHQGRRQR